MVLLGVLQLLQLVPLLAQLLQGQPWAGQLLMLLLGQPRVPPSLP
jgi:hypothetical protein